MDVRPNVFEHAPAFNGKEIASVEKHHFTDQKNDMIRRQLQDRGIFDPRVLDAMQKVAREHFVPTESYKEAYSDQALRIGCGQTISQPYIVALMTEALELLGHETVLEIGTGSGYQTAVLAELAAEVLSLERMEPLVEKSRKTLAAMGYRNVTIRLGDGTLGWPERSPFSRIIATAMAEQCPPSLFDQLAEDGILVIPLGNRDSQILYAIRKQHGQAKSTALCGCRFVPLVGEQGWAE
jgi:protein-L-isoaspartate(D-aspartate) O-methyltransferase